MDELNQLLKPLTVYIGTTIALLLNWTDQVSAILSIFVLLLTIIYTSFLTWAKALEIKERRNRLNGGDK